jgi:hypothetical protein
MKRLVGVSTITGKGPGSLDVQIDQVAANALTAQYPSLKEYDASAQNHDAGGSRCDAHAGHRDPAMAEPGNGHVFTLAVYGDAPYGTSPTDTAEFQATPAFIDSINNDPQVSLVAHVGDIHSGKQY